MQQTPQRRENVQIQISTLHASVSSCRIYFTAPSLYGTVDNNHGATLSFEHDPALLRAAEDAEKAVLEYYMYQEQVEEVRVDLPQSTSLTDRFILLSVQIDT